MKKRLYIFTEGHSEEAYVNGYLAPYLNDAFSDYIDNVIPLLIPNIISKYGVYPRKNKGGYNKRTGFQTILAFMKKQMLNDRKAIYTTMYDYYGFPIDFPAKEYAQKVSQLYQKAEIMEKCLHDSVVAEINGYVRFVPYFQMHEFDALLFSDIDVCKRMMNLNDSQYKRLSEVLCENETPEHINNSPDTAPSKRLELLLPGYRKMIDGVNTIGSIQIDVIRKQFIHFDQWLKKLEEEIKKR